MLGWNAGAVPVQLVQPVRGINPFLHEYKGVSGLGSSLPAPRLGLHKAPRAGPARRPPLALLVAVMGFIKLYTSRDIGVKNQHTYKKK